MQCPHEHRGKASHVAPWYQPGSVSWCGDGTGQDFALTLPLFRMLVLLSVLFSMQSLAWSFIITRFARRDPMTLIKVDVMPSACCSLQGSHGACCSLPMSEKEVCFHCKKKKILLLQHSAAPQKKLTCRLLGMLFWIEIRSTFRQ